MRNNFYSTSLRWRWINSWWVRFSHANSFLKSCRDGKALSIIAIPSKFIFYRNQLKIVSREITAWRFLRLLVYNLHTLKCLIASEWLIRRLNVKCWMTTNQFRCTAEGDQSRNRVSNTNEEFKFPAQLLICLKHATVLVSNWIKIFQRSLVATSGAVMYSLISQSI